MTTDTAHRVANDILAAVNPPHPADSLTATRPQPQATSSVVRLSDITPEPIQWLSPGRLALGKVTVLDGDPGLGKSTLLTTRDGAELVVSAAHRLPRRHGPGLAGVCPRRGDRCGAPGGAGGG